jgi:hypothetical protein
LQQSVPVGVVEMFNQRSDALYDSIFEQCSQHLEETLKLEIAEGEDANGAKGNIHNAMSNRSLKAAKAENKDAKKGKYSVSVMLSIDEKSIGITLSLKESESPKA